MLRSLRSRRIRPARIGLILLPLLVGASIGGPAAAQRPAEDTYLLGEQNRLQMVVHIIGEVAHPGEYQVTDDTDVLDLVSKAGGPTDLANLGNVSVRHRETLGASHGDVPAPIAHVDLTTFLQRDDGAAPPVLQPGDVVVVPRNRMAGWRTAFGLVRDLSVIATTYFLYLRVH